MKLSDLKQYLASVAHINYLKDTCGLEPSGFARDEGLGERHLA